MNENTKEQKGIAIICKPCLEHDHFHCLERMQVTVTNVVCICGWCKNKHIGEPINA